ncbi:MAG: hypothetical protein HY005_01825 [Candidatus Staskawiczbacteria bacterium]|nr:hypothetical protein [Candidatus Staskawiczbacteria bacterium]
MSYKSEYLTDLNKIVDLIKDNKDSDAVSHFSVYLENLDIGKYQSTIWNENWRRKVYKFGELFKVKDAGIFIDAIDNFLNSNKSKNVEAVEFIYSEIIWNYFALGTVYISGILKKLIDKYKLNPEFRNSYAHFLEIKGNYDLSIEEALVALKIEPRNQDFYVSCFNKYKRYFDVLILKGKIVEAEKIIRGMEKILKKEDVAFQNIIISLWDRLNDHKIINERINGIADIVRKATNKEQSKIIEIMGFFVAILGFVFISINLATNNLKFQQVLLIMMGMAIILAFFATLVSILFNKSKLKDIFSDFKFWLIIILLLLFFVVAFKYQEIFRI